MSNYEVDFLQDQTQWFQPFVSNLTGSKGWLDGMAEAAAANNISVQVAQPLLMIEIDSLLMIRVIVDWFSLNGCTDCTVLHGASGCVSERAVSSSCY